MSYNQVHILCIYFYSKNSLRNKVDSLQFYLPINMINSQLDIGSKMKGIINCLRICNPNLFHIQCNHLYLLYFHHHILQQLSKHHHHNSYNYMIKSTWQIYLYSFCIILRNSQNSHPYKHNHLLLKFCSPLYYKLCMYSKCYKLSIDLSILILEKKLHEHYLFLISK